MLCPNCHIENLETATCCECGFDFRTGQVSAKPNGSLIRTLAMRVNILCALVGLLLIVVALKIWMERTLPEQWQYTIAAPKDEDLQTEIDKMGADGWELVFARRASGGDQSNPKMSYEMIFKKRGAARGSR